MRVLRFPFYAVLVLVAASLVGCGDSGTHEVRQWMDKKKAETKITVPKLSPPKTFVPFVYSDKDTIDPFDQSKLLIALQQPAVGADDPWAPDPNRVHGPLEVYPLDSFAMVGAINKGGPHAILQVDNKLFNVKANDYIGQRDGKITAITDTQVFISERVQGANGKWGESKTSLELQENKK